MNVRGLIKTGKTVAINNLPTILAGMSVAGVVVTAFLASKGTLAAEQYLQETEENPEELDTPTRIKKTYKFYIPAVAVGATTAACILGGNKISLTRIAKATSLAVATEKTLVENREKIKEVFGEKGLRKLDEKINEEHAARYFGSLDNVYETGHGSVLCCEGYLTGIKFRANPEWVYKCVNIINAELNSGSYRTMNDFIELLIPNIDVKSLPELGDEIGFNLNVNGQLMDISVDSGLIPDTQEPYLIFTQRNTPISNPSRYL